MQFVKLLFEMLKEFYTKHKIVCWVVLAIIIMIVTNLFQYFVWVNPSPCRIKQHLPLFASAPFLHQTLGFSMPTEDSPQAILHCIL